MTPPAGPWRPEEVEAMIAKVDAELANKPRPGQTAEQAANLDRYADWLFG